MMAPPVINLIALGSILATIIGLAIIGVVAAANGDQLEWLGIDKAITGLVTLVGVVLAARLQRLRGGGETNTTITWSASTSNFCSIIVELDASP